MTSSYERLRNPRLAQKKHKCCWLRRSNPILAQARLFWPKKQLASWICRGKTATAAAFLNLQLQGMQPRLLVMLHTVKTAAFRELHLQGTQPRHMHPVCEAVTPRIFWDAATISVAGACCPAIVYNNSHVVAPILAGCQCHNGWFCLPHLSFGHVFVFSKES